MLTCKSLFGLGYRGERLIEPSKKSTRVVERGLETGTPSLGAARPISRKADRGDTVKLPGHLARPSVPPLGGNTLWHPGESRGYGNNPADRDNRQPSPTGSNCLWMQFTD